MAEEVEVKEAPEEAPLSISSFVKGLGSRKDWTNPDAKKEPDGKTNDTGDKGGDAGILGNSAAAAEATAAEAAAKAKSDADAAQAKADEQAAADAAAKAGKPDAAEGDDKWPRNSKDWDTFKARRKERETALTKEIEAQKAKAKEYESKVAEYEAKLSTKPAADPDTAAELERLRAFEKEASERLLVLDVTKDPRFEKFFDGKVGDVIAEAKAIVGDEKSARVEEILKLPDNAYRKMLMDEFLAEIEDEGARTDLRAVMRDLKKVNMERESEIKKAAEHKTKLDSERTTKLTEGRKVYEKAFEDVVKKLQDPTKGFAAFQKRDGDEAWNKGVESRIESAKKLLTANNLSPEIVVQTAFNSVALPAVIEGFRKEWDEWQSEKAKLEAQVKELKSAQPGAGRAITPTDAPRPFTAETSPQEAMKQWTSGMAKSRG